MPDNNELAMLLAKLFIQRKDTKAVQVADGGYRPVRQPWKMGDLRAHVSGEQTYGHYTCDQDSLTKLIVFDIDLDKDGHWVEEPSFDELAEIQSTHEFQEKLIVHDAHPREDWRDPRHPGRPWWKKKLRNMVEMISSTAFNDYGFKTVATYSGNKGCHVYVFFPEPTDIGIAREMAVMILDSAGEKFHSDYRFYKFKGDNFYKYNDPDHYNGFQDLTIEIFPKQSSMGEKDLGNLVRLPAGVNRKGPTFKRKSGEIVHSKAFFIDQRTAHDQLVPHPDPVALLKSGNPYAS